MAARQNIIEAKVKVGSAVSGLTGLVLSSLETYVFDGSVPSVLEQVLTQGLGTAIPAAITFAAAWLTKHTPRTEITTTDR